MAKLKLTMACWDYDRTRPLMDGRVQPEGIELDIKVLRPRETFQRMLDNQEFDYHIVCNKICGNAHFNMKLKVVIEDRKNYEKWLKGQKNFSSTIMATSEEPAPTEDNKDKDQKLAIN
jgi:heme/copper-type cytochrome/quinol oxidase subunit 2